MRHLVPDLYEVTIRGGRCAAPWRGGNNPDSVAINRKTMHDFKTGETYNAWTFLTEVVGYTSAQAAEYLLERAGMATGGAARPRPRRTAKTTEQVDEAEKARREAYNAKQQAAALELQRTALTTGSSAYLERKGVAAIFDMHEVAPVVLPDGETLPGMVYGNDQHGAFVQLILRTLDSAVTGYQKIYDDGAKKFVSGSKPTGAFVLLQPKGQPLPKDGERMAGLQLSGYELGVCEGFATGASVCLARPRAYIACALSANNLGPVLEALRGVYGYTRRIKRNRGDDYKMQKALDLTVWGDLDESGTGQQASHRAAIKYHATVRLPTFKGGGHGDFNDLHAARGLETVKRTRKTQPDARLAFAKELSKQKLSPHKHLDALELPEQGGALIVKAPQESGKTHRLAELLTDSGLRVLVVTHRESLAKNLAARLRFECYQDYPAHMLRDIPRLVICFDSLQKLAIGGELPAYDVLVLDESEQVLEHTTGRHIKRKAANFAALEHYLRTAPRIICADANAGNLTHDTLRRFNPKRAITWKKHEHHIAAGRRLHFTYERDDALDALEASTVPTWYASDSLRRTRDLSAYYDQPDTLVINSETATTDEAAAYLRDPTGEAPKYRRMIASPSVQTGISDDSGHWPRVIGDFTGYSSTPQDAMQALIRARGAPELTVYANPRIRRKVVSVQDALDGTDALDSYEAAALSSETHGTANPNYERLLADVEHRRSERQATYKRRLVLEALRLGYSVTYDVPRDLNPDDLEARDGRRKAIREAGLELYVSDRADAERISEARAKQLDEAYTLSQSDRFALDQYRLRAFYVLADDVPRDQLAEMLRLDDYEALRKKILNYECLIEPREVAEARSRGELDAGVLKGDSAAHLLRHEYHQRLGAVVGLDAETEAQAQVWSHKRAALEERISTLEAERLEAHDRRKGEIDKALTGLEIVKRTLVKECMSTSYSATSESVQSFKTWCVKHYQALKRAGLVTASLDNLKAKPLETIGDSLTRCGLEQKSDGKRTARSYALELASVSTMGDYSRPRRSKWDFAQQNDIKNPLNGLLRKNGETPSQTGLISSVENVKAQPLQETHEVAPTSATDDRRAPLKVPGYEALRVIVREAPQSGTRTKLTEAFRYADNGDPAALDALTAYMQHLQIAREASA